MRSTLLLCTIFLSLTFGLQSQNEFFQQADAFFKKHVQNGRIDYQGVKGDETFSALIQQVEQIDFTELKGAEQKAFLVNAYNLLVIKGTLDAYPIASVKDVAGFFDRKRHLISGKSMTLNELEKNYLLEVFEDPRLHFVLVCGAKGCPPIIPEAYFPDRLEQQLERQTRLALNDLSFIRINPEEQKVFLSEIFRWYVGDFGGSQKAALAFINGYREKSIPENYSIGYYTYDWSLNGTMSGLAGPVKANNAARYIVSSTIPKGTTETKIFNNLYTQRTRNGMGEFSERATFFTSITSFLYGLNHRVNIGFDLRYRMVRYGAETDSPLDVLGESTRQGVTTFGPKVRIAPIPRWTNFSIQSALWFPTGDDLAGRSGEQRFIDWEGPIWWTQVFNDFPIGNKFSLFTEIDLLWEDMGRGDQGRANRVSTPATVIFSYFPTPKATLYALTNYSPFWQQDYDYFYQLGLGSKYQFNPNFELELSYTYFTNEFLNMTMGRAATYNLGVRFNL
jgi:hypothetical protein